MDHHHDVQQTATVESATNAESMGLEQDINKGRLTDKQSEKITRFWS
jgi:hypothetical protein